MSSRTDGKRSGSSQQIPSSSRRQVSLGLKKRVLVAAFPDAEDLDVARAKGVFAVRPSTSAALVMEAYPTGQDELVGVVDALEGDAERVIGGDLSKVEAMLLGQAQALQSIFVTLSRNARGHHDVRSFDACLRMALKAQNQCRMTLESIACLRAPRTVFAKQANINHGGNQQVNNVQCGVTPENSASRENELLEGTDGKWMDARASRTASGADSSMAAVGSVDRSADRRR